MPAPQIPCGRSGHGVLHLLQFNPDLIQFNAEYITIYAGYDPI